MSVACKFVANSQTVYPELPIGMEDVPVGASVSLLNGGSRFYYRKTIKRWTLALHDATEAEATTWRSAFPLTASYTLTDETSTSYTVRTVSRSIPLVTTVPAIQGGSNTTGPATYDISVEVEQIS